MKILLAVLFFFLTLTCHSQTLTVKAFNKNASKLGMQFIMPAGYHVKEILPNRDLQYSFAIVNSDSTMEVRYSLFPLKPLIKKYKMAKKSKKVFIDPDSSYVVLMKTNGLSMTNGILPEINEMPIEISKNFNANYAGTYSFDFMCEFGKGYKHGQFVCLHKKKIADVIITFMTNNIKTHADLMASPFYALTFK